MDVFRNAKGFAVNILSEAQKDTSVLFASKRHDKFEAASWRPGPFGNPLIEGSAAWFDCARYQVIDAGDHIILMGHIEAFSYSDANPLGYARGGYVTLGLEQAAVNAASKSHTVVGAILLSVISNILNLTSIISVYLNAAVHGFVIIVVAFLQRGRR